MAACSSWEAQARERQQEICALLIDYDWELYKNGEEEYLKKKVEYILCGPNKNELDAETATIITKICEKILQEGNRGNCLSGETCMAFIYVFWTQNGEDLSCWPIFKVPKDKNGQDAYFIDINSRVYKNWDDFLQNNQFPSCEYCYPTGGEYVTDEKGNVILDFGKSPASSVSKSVIQYLDYANSGLALGTTAVAAASLFVPVAGPLLQASLWLTRGICAYTTMRSGSTLIDRSTHKQSVGFQDSESRSCWFSIGGSVFGAASSSATNVTANMARSGQVMGRFGCATVNALTMSTIAVNGLGLLNSLHCLVDKYNKNQLTSLDVFQFSASLLLFAHATVNVQTAKTIIEQTQNSVIQDFENNLRSNRHRKVFRKVVRNTKYQKNSMEGNAQVIRSLKHINNVDDFFSALVRMDKQFRPTRSRATFTDGGLITINDNLPLDPTQLVQATPEQRILILEATKKYAGNEMLDTEFRSMVETIIGKIPPVSTQGSQLTANLKEILGLPKSGNKGRPNIGSKYSYPLLSAYEKMEIMTLLKKFEEGDHEQILQIASILLKALGWTSGMQYVEVAYFVCGLIRSIARNSKVEKGAISELNSITVTEYCQAALQQFIKDPSRLVEIFHHVKLLYDTLSTRNSVPTHFRHAGLYEISQLAGVLLIIDKPLWLRLITFAEQIFHILGLKKPELIINVTKGLCQNIQGMLIDIERDLARRQYYSSNALPQMEHNWFEERKEIAREHCSVILNTLTEDSEIKKSVIEEINKDYISDTSSESSTIDLKYTEQTPLIINRSFWDKDELELLSEEEILSICRQSLCTELWPTDCSIDRSDISKIFVNIDEKLVVLKCNFDEGIISAYVSVAPTL